MGPQTPRFVRTTVRAILRRKEFRKMSHALSFKPSDFELLSSEEEQIEYVETHLDEIIARLRANKQIPPEDVESLVHCFTNYRSEVEGAISWEEFAKEFMKD
jgi:hypothetical protein